jgi:hypothetical protein
VCVLTASKGVVSGSGASMVVGRVPDIYGARIHKTVKIKFKRLRWLIKRVAQLGIYRTVSLFQLQLHSKWLTC